MQKTIKIFIISGIILLVLAALYLFLQSMLAKNQVNTLKTENIVLTEEKIRLREQLENELAVKKDIENRIIKLHREISGLEEAKNLKNLYNNNVEKLNTLNATYSDIEKENISLKQSNVALTNRIKALTEEFNSTINTLQTVKRELGEAKSDKTILSYTRKIQKTEELLLSREKEMNMLKQQINDLQKDNVNFSKEKSLLGKKITKLEGERKDFEVVVEDIKRKLDDKNRVGEQLSVKLKEMRTVLQDSESQRNQLRGDVDKLREEIASLEKKLDSRNDKIASLEDELRKFKDSPGRVNELEQEKARIQEQLNQAKDELDKRKTTVASLEDKSNRMSSSEVSTSEDRTQLQDKLNQAYALYDTAKAQVVKFSELLMSKEVDLEASKQKIKALEDELKALRELPSDGKTASYSSDYVFLQNRIKTLNEMLADKEIQLQKKDEELLALKTAKMSLDEQIKQQEKKYGDTTVLYDDFKKQMQQTSELLSRRDNELLEKSREISTLKSEIVLMQAEYKIKEQELRDLQERYRRTMEDLSRTAQLNMSLQEKIIISPDDNTTGLSEDKEKAEKLKKEIEQLMGK
ncbi:MAG: hypothetical protein HY810_01750 [Candidatus Omnitrophica bacterium]|nr:hypothetical protein [Candidatus Omnitrophota bacterium]